MLMETLRLPTAFAVEPLRIERLPALRPTYVKVPPMQDLLWLAILGGLFAATLAYIRLCDQA